MSRPQLQFWDLMDMRAGIVSPEIHISGQGCVNLYGSNMVLKIRPHLQLARREVTFMFAAQECSVEVIAFVNVPRGGGGFVMPRLRTIESSSLSLLDKIHILRQMRPLLENLHSKGIIHGDVKLANMLLDDRENGRLKFCDFGSAHGMLENMPPYTLSARWCSPYRLGHGRRAPLTTEDDIYSLGWAAWELFAGTVPYPHIEDEIEATQHILAGDVPDLNALGTEEAIAFISECWTHQRLPN